MSELINKIIEKVGFGKIFFFAVVIAYIVLYFSDAGLFFNSFNKFFAIFLNVFWTIILVFVFIFLVNLFVDERKIAKNIGKKSGLRGWLIAILGGLISHGPIYAWYPLLSDLKEKGMRNAFIATFLYNRAIKIPLIPLMIHYFGLTFVVVLSILMIFFSIVNGKIVEVLVGE